MSTMNRRAIAVVLALLVVAAGTVILLLPRSASSFHLEAEYSGDGIDPIFFWLTGLQDCSLNVSFIDDPDLMYEIDVELYESQPAPSAFDLSVDQFLDIRFEGILSIKSLQVTLGSGVSYMIRVSSFCSNVNATFIYANNVIGSAASLHYSATGSFISLTFTEEMVFSDIGMEVSVGAAGEPDLAYLHTDLADGVNGKATFREPLSIHSNTGWVYRSGFLNEVTYSTDPVNPEPLLEIRIRAAYGVHVWLND